MASRVSYRDDGIGAQYIVTHVFLDKASAEVEGFGSGERMILSEAEQQVLLQAVTPEQLAHVLGPPTFEPREIADIYRVLYGRWRRAGGPDDLTSQTIDGEYPTDLSSRVCM